MEERASLASSATSLSLPLPPRAELVISYSWRVVAGAETAFCELWRQATQPASWQYRLCAEEGEEGVFALRTRWRDEAAWLAALEAAGAGPHDGLVLVDDEMRKLIAEVYPPERSQVSSCGALFQSWDPHSPLRLSSGPAQTRC